MEAWVEEGVAPTKEVDLKGFDAAVVERTDQRNKYEEKKKESTLEYKRLEEMDRKIISMLQGAGLTKFASSVGTISTRIDHSYRVPKDADSKHRFFDFIRQNDGEEMLQTLLTINSATANSYAKSKVAEADEKGELDFKIDGLEDPTMKVSLSFRKGK